MKQTNLKKGIAVLVMGAILFSCSKTEDDVIVQQQITSQDYKKASQEFDAIAQKIMSDEDVFLENYDNFIQKAEKGELFDKEYVSFEEFATIFEENIGIDKSITKELLQTINENQHILAIENSKELIFDSPNDVLPKTQASIRFVFDMLGVKDCKVLFLASFADTVSIGAAIVKTGGLASVGMGRAFAIAYGYTIRTFYDCVNDSKKKHIYIPEHHQGKPLFPGNNEDEQASPV